MTDAFDNLALQGSPSSETPKTFVNHIKARGETVLGTILTIPSDAIAQIAGQSDGDFVLIDMEHVPLTIDVVTRMVHAYVASSRGSKYPIIRIPSHGVEWVKWVRSNRRYDARRS